ncbi:MAG: bifunctional riboflavin kinase/FAD synthetase [Nitriliruptoraceae bacterium]|nr:bifunctional riboflavin kinase/FAD synthetase [Nitriliruptoraceae bacterium]
MSMHATTVEAIEVAPSVVTIGNFDGVHRGHRVLLRRAVDTAADAGLRSVAVTFEPHPAAVLRPGSEPLRLQSLDERVESLGACGVDEVVVLPFTAELAALSPEGFIEQVLVDGIGVHRIVIGTNFRFGHRAAGDVVTLVERGEDHGFTVEAVTLRELEGAAVSSSAIRQRLEAGELAWASAALGRPYAVRGTVVTGEGRGRTIGVPTANLDIDAGRLVPGNGVYAGRASVGEQRWAAVTNVGVRPTFDGQHRSVEVHLIDVATDLDLYGSALRFTFEHRIRGEQRFSGPDELVARIRTDIAEARDLLA